MKNTLLSLSFLLLAQFAQGQNLVPNPSFEDTNYCPGGGAILGAKYWYVAEQTPDYFNDCCVYWQFSVPQNLLDYQYAATGIAYCGFYTYSTLGAYYREKIGVELINPLNVGTKYFVSFKVSATKRYVNAATNKTGALFSTGKYTPANPSPTNDFCQMWTDSIITDTVNWVQVWGSFVADSAYTYLTLGNFFTNAHTDTFCFWRTNAVQAYYFIDDVCVSEDSATCITTPVSVNALQERKRELTVYPNPANNYVEIITETDAAAVLEFYTAEGNIFLKQNIPRGHNELNIDVTQMSNGFYYVRIVTNKKINSKKIIIHH